LDFPTTLIIAVGLSLDAFAVSISCGMSVQQSRLRLIVLPALFFGFFQGFMPLIGWGVGMTVRTWIEFLDHWIAFTLLGLIGLHMIYQAIHEPADRCFNPADIKVLFLLAIATSIDALVVGIGFALLRVDILSAVVIIGLVTFILSIIGIRTGRRLGVYLGRKAEIFGGVVLIAMGIKILIEHLVKNI
jgi:putative Mn2+ efflux pump MntP